MKKMTIMMPAFIGFLLLLLLSPAPLLADAQKGEWFGTWAMNHDGRMTTIRELKGHIDLKSLYGNSFRCNI
jgi:hypothetical protein